MISRKVEPQELFKKHSREMRFLNRLKGEIDFYFWQSEEGYEMQLCQPGMMPSSLVFSTFEAMVEQLHGFDAYNRKYRRSLRVLEVKMALRRLLGLRGLRGHRAGYPPERS